MAPPVALRASQSRGRPCPSPRRPRPHLLLPRPTLRRLRDNLPAPWPRQPILRPLPRRRRPLRPGGELAPHPGTRQPRELDISYANPQLLPSALRSASTLLVARTSHCGFPNEMAMPSMNFPLLKQLSLMDVFISEDVFHGLLSGCQALESLYLSEVFRPGCLRVSSPNLRTIGFRDNTIQETELVIEDAPHLVRLLIVPYRSCRKNCVTIRVITEPKLEILGPLLPVVSKLVSQGISPVSPANSMRTVKIFALRSSGHELDAVLNILSFTNTIRRIRKMGLNTTHYIQLNAFKPISREWCLGHSWAMRNSMTSPGSLF